MAKKTYIGVSVIPNPPPISSTSGWLPNQNTTVSVSYSALRVVSNQNTSTPGVYTDLTSAIPSGTYVTLTYTMRGNVRVCASLWNNSSSSGVLETQYYQLTDAFQTFSISGNVSNVANRLYFFMSNPTTSSWFEVGEIQLSYGVAKAVKKMYIGIGGVARKVKKVYMGVNGVAKMIYQACVHVGGTAATCTTAQTCTKCGIVLQNALGHNYSSTTINPTATSDGYTLHTCTRCGHSYRDSYITPVSFTVTKDNRSLAGYTGASGENLNIPAVFYYGGTWYRVTAIGDDAFRDTDNFVSVTIPNSVTTIGSAAFNSASSCTQYMVPTSVTSIGLHAFYRFEGPVTVIYAGTKAQWLSIAGYEKAIRKGSTLQCTDGTFAVGYDGELT